MQVFLTDRSFSSTVRNFLRTIPLFAGTSAKWLNGKISDKKSLEKLDYFGEPEGNSYKKDNAKAKSFVLLMIMKYAGYFSKNSDTSMGRYLLSYLKLYSDYYVINLAEFLSGTVKSLSSLNTEMDSSDAISPITELKVPVLLISGEEDMICPTPTAKRWFDNLNAPKKEFVEIKNASHMVNFEKPEE